MNLERFKTKLEEDKARLEAQLGQIGQRNPARPEDWEAMPAEAGQDMRITESTELADAFEEFQNRSSIEAHLEERLNDVIAALGRIENSTYGICEVCKEKIEEARLEANPSAPTCIKHSRG